MAVLLIAHAYMTQVHAADNLCDISGMLSVFLPYMFYKLK